jgi:hypothetical protein
MCDFGKEFTESGRRLFERIELVLQVGERSASTGNGAA